MIGRTMVLVLSITLLICLCMQFFLLSVPFLKQLEFERICHKYSMIMDRDGGLTAQNQDLLVADLTNRGFTIVELLAATDVPYEEEMLLAVKVQYPARKLSSKLVMEELPLFLNFQTTQMSRKTVLG